MATNTTTNSDNNSTATPISKTPELTYLTSSNGQIYMNGILIDDCFDIQYSYKELKEPIYGYNSKHYDTILPGNVIVSGSFTINYKHDGYLYYVLNKGSSNISKANKNIILAKDFNKQYKDALFTYRNIQKQIKDAKTDLADQKSFLTAASVLHSDAINKATEENAYTKSILDSKQVLLDNLYANISSEEKALVEQDLKQYYEISDAIDEQSNQYLDDINSLNAKIVSVKSNIIIDENKIDDANNAIIQEEYYLSKGLITQSDYNVQIAQHRDTIYLLQNEIEELNSQLDQLNDELDNKKDLYLQLKDDGNDQLQNIIDRNPNISSIAAAEAELSKAKIDNIFQERTSELNVIDASENYANQKTETDKSSQRLSDLQNGLNDQLKKIQQIKDSLDKLQGSWDDLAGQDAINTKLGRAEDISIFNIFISYNGMTHKIIEGCTLTGHTHVIQQGGECVKEYYSFLARSIK